MSEFDLIDPDLADELEELPTEDPFVTEYGTQGSSANEKSIGFAEKWFPDEESWQGKTKITPIQAKNLALLRNLSDAFEEIEELDGFLNEVVTDYEMYLTSIEGESRHQHMQILKSLFGGPSDADETMKSAILSKFASNQMENGNND